MSKKPRSSRDRLLKAIRAKCLDCCVYQPMEVRLCSAEDCPLWSFRFGNDPEKKPKKATPAILAALSEGRKKRWATSLNSSVETEGQCSREGKAS